MTYIVLIRFKIKWYIINTTTLIEQRNKFTDSSRAILFISEDIACSKPLYNAHSRRTTVKQRPLTNSTLFILGTRPLVATILICLSGDVESNPRPKFEINQCSTRRLKVSHLNIRSLLPKIDSLRLLINKNPININAPTNIAIKKILLTI